MTRIDQAVSRRTESEAGGQAERPSPDSSRRFARYVTMARTGSPPEDPSGEAPGSTSGVPPPVTDALRGAAPSIGIAQPDSGGSQRSVILGPYGTQAPEAPEERLGPQDGPGALVSEPLRPQVLAAYLENAAPLAPDTRAMELARSLFRALPLAAARERTLTVSFPAAGGAVEQIVLSTAGGIVSLLVTARAPARERVAAALPELARLLRSHGLRIGSVGVA
jgi:hypothetical protein